MKKIVLFTLACLIGVNAFAQQALFGGQSITSPEVHADNTVTFRFLAPKAIKVQLMGEFLPPQTVETSRGMTEMPGIVDLQEGTNGVWEYTTLHPVASDLYGYIFIVDGIRMTDPNNVYQVRDVATVQNILLIGGGKGDYYAVNDVPHGSVTKRWYNSPGLNATRRITIYTPPGYETSKESYPVLYLLHGAGGDEEVWINLGRASQILDNLIAQGKSKQMIVVMPNGHTENPAAPGESSRGFYKPYLMLDRNFWGGDMEASFMDIIRFVESNYRVKKGMANRAIAGLSMGAHHSENISANYPNSFDYIGLFSGALVTPRDTTTIIHRDFDKKLEIQKINGYKLYWIACGNGDTTFPGVAEYRKKLDNMGMKYTFRESEGGHTWTNWRVYLTEFVPLLFN